jgi:hypothetical protein
VIFLPGIKAARTYTYEQQGSEIYTGPFIVLFSRRDCQAINLAKRRDWIDERIAV